MRNMKKTSSGLNFIKRAYLNVIRSKVRSIILIITFFVIGNFVIIGLGVSNAAENAKTLTRLKMRAVVSIDTDYNKIDEYLKDKSDEEQQEFWNNSLYSVKYNDLKPILDDERVTAIQASSYTRALYSNDENLHYVPLDNDYEKEREESGNIYNPGDFFLKTNVFPNCIELIEGTFSIADGTFYTQEDIENGNDVVVISKELAEHNGFRIGDIFRVTLEDQSYINDLMNNVPNLERESFNMDLKIVGIYEHTNHITPDHENFQNLMPYDNPDNLVMMPATSLQYHTNLFQDILNEYYATMYGEDMGIAKKEGPLIDQIDLSSIKVFIDDPLNVEDFVRDYEGQINDFCMLNANNEEFKKLSKPLDTLNIYANLIIWLVVINAIVIITLVVALTLKTREYEIGVMLSIGASKAKIIGQFFLELAIVAIVGFTLATFSGALISKKVGNVVLDYQIQRDELNENVDYYYDSVWNDDYFTHITLDDLVSEYDSSISPIIIGEIYVMGLGIVFISTLIPAMMIMRFNPKRILMNQN